MTNTYGSMSKFCTVFSYESEASTALLECFWNCCLSWMYHLGQPFLWQYFEHAAFWICLHLVDQPVSHCSNHDET